MDELFEDLYNTLLITRGEIIPQEIKLEEDPFARGVELVSYLQGLNPESAHLLESHARDIADYILSLSNDTDLIQRLSLFSWNSDE